MMGGASPDPDDYTQRRTNSAPDLFETIRRTGRRPPLMDLDTSLDTGSFQQEVQCQLTEIFAALDQLSPCDGTRRRCASPEMETVPNSITLITEQLLAEFRDFQVEVRSRLKEVSTEVDGLQRSGSQIKSEVYEMKQAMRDLIIGLRKQFADDLSKSFVSKADSVPARPKRFSGEARQDELAPTPYHRDCALLPREKEFDPDENINQMMGRVDRHGALALEEAAGGKNLARKGLARAAHQQTCRHATFRESSRDASHHHGAHGGSPH